MTETLRHVVSGEPFRPQASVWNAFVDVVRDVGDQRTIFSQDSIAASLINLIPAQVDSSGHPAVGQPGYGSKHCKKLKLAAGVANPTGTIPNPAFELTDVAIRFCVPWTGAIGDIPNDATVWILQIGGANIILLVECE